MTCRTESGDARGVDGPRPGPQDPRVFLLGRIPGSPPGGASGPGDPGGRGGGIREERKLSSRIRVWYVGGGGSPIDETSGQPKYFCMGKPNCLVKFKLCLSYWFHISPFFSLKFVYQFGCQFKKIICIF